MPNNTPHPIWSVLIYTTVVAATIWFLWDRVPTFMPSPAVWISLALAAALWLFGFFFVGGRFVKPVWKAYGKGVAFMAFCYFLLIAIGLWAWPLIIVHLGIGFVFHLVICRREGIDWRTIQPREKYVALMEKYGRGDFS